MTNKEYIEEIINLLTKTDIDMLDFILRLLKKYLQVV